LLIEPAKKYIEHGLLLNVRRVNTIRFNTFPNVPKKIRKGGIQRFIQDAAEFILLAKLDIPIDMRISD
jgi:hypothetical protein